MGPVKPISCNSNQSHPLNAFNDFDRLQRVSVTLILKRPVDFVFAFCSNDERLEVAPRVSTSKQEEARRTVATERSRPLDGDDNDRKLLPNHFDIATKPERNFVNQGLEQQMLIIVATYNEIDSLPRLVLQLSELLPSASLLIIDDASPDGTGNWAEASLEKYPKMSVLHREGKLGLGTAAITGFQWAVERGFDLIATMDADLSHDPASMKEMVSRINDPKNEEVGVCIGSRYVRGGGTEGWPWTRKLASRLVNFFARVMLGLKTKDNSGAFRIYRREALELLDLSSFKSGDYAYLEEILWRLKKQGVAMIEHPIVFRNRELGKSKTNPILGLKVFWQIFKLGVGIWK